MAYLPPDGSGIDTSFSGTEYVPPVGNNIILGLTYTGPITGMYGEPYNIYQGLFRRYVEPAYFVEQDLAYYINERYIIVEAYLAGSWTDVMVYSFLNSWIEPYRDMPVILAYNYEFYGDMPVLIRSWNEPYVLQSDPDTSVSVLRQLWHLADSAISILQQSYHIAELNAISVLEQLYDVSGMNLAVSTLPQTWSLISSNLVSDDPVIQDQQDVIVDLIETGAPQAEIEDAINDLNLLLPTANAVSYAIFINEVQVFSENIDIDYNDETYYIQGNITIENPAYFPLCVKNAPVRIEIVTPQDSKTYNLLIAGKSTKQTTSSITYSLECKSKTYLLDSKFVPTLQREFSESLASEIVIEMAAYAGVNVIWNLYQDGVLVDQTIPSGFLFANNEKPLSVIKKITEALGAIIQTTPEGDMEIIHPYPVKVPDYEIATPDYVLDSSIRFESISTSYEEKLGINTVNISDQLTSDTSFTLEEVEISSTEKYVKGFHVPFGTEDVYLDTSGGTTIFIEYLGIEEATVPGPEDDETFELVEFIGGTGNTTKPIYAINSVNWVEDVLGAITSAEDGTLTSEILGESLLEITYTTRYYKWRVTSPELRHVQFILRPVIDG